MISLNTQQKLPGSALGYLLTLRLIVGVLLIALGVFVFSLGTITGTTTVGGVTTPTTFPSFIPALVLIAAGLLLPLIALLWYSTFSYTVGDQNITINSGIIIRQSKTIDFNKVQNVDNVRGPLQMLFGLTAVNIWTASQDQLQISTFSMGNGRSGTRITKKPEGKLYLSEQDAAELKAMIANKGTVQNVNIVSSQVASAASTIPPQA